MDTYNDMIIVGFKGGFGGDLFASILDSNFNRKTKIKKQITYNNSSIDNMHAYPAHLAELKGLHYLLFSLDVQLFPNNKTTEDAFIQFHKANFVNRCFNMVFDTDPEQIIENIIYYGRTLYEHNKPKVWCTHYCSRPPATFKNFTMERMFPGSTKLRLWCEPKYHDLFSALAFFKLDEAPINKHTVNMIHNSKINYVVYEEHLTTPDRFDYLNEPFEDFIDIDVGKLFFEDDSNVDIIEKQLSDICGQKIDLNKSYICNEYKVKNNNILETILGPNYLNNSIETNLSLFMKHVRKREEHFQQLV